MKPFKSIYTGKGVCVVNWLHNYSYLYWFGNPTSRTNLAHLSVSDGHEHDTSHKPYMLLEFHLVHIEAGACVQHLHRCRCPVYYRHIETAALCTTFT